MRIDTRASDGGFYWLLFVAFLFLLLILAPSAHAKYSGGTGEPNAPYRISDYNDLYTLADDTNDYDKCFILTADIDLNPTLPNRRQLTTALIAPDISTNSGFQGTPFTGTFDGNDCNILNLTIVGNDYLGLFGYLGTDGMITDLGVEDINVGGLLNVGGLVGCVDESIINSCYSTGQVTGDYYVGGLVGENYNGKVISSHANILINTTGSSNGGVVGYNEMGIITSCYATGQILGDGSLRLGAIDWCNVG